MAAICQSNVRLFRPNAQPGDVLVFTLADIGVSDDTGANMFFGAREIQRADDVNDTTFFPNAQIPGGFRNAGTIGGSGTQIQYTVDPTMEAGDCIMIEYTATNTQNQSDSDCTQTFEVCFADEEVVAPPPAPEPDVVACPTIENITLQNSDTEGFTLNLATTLGINGLTLSSVSLFDASDNVVSGGFITNGGIAFTQPAPVAGGIYRLQYQLTDGTETSPTCRIFINVGQVFEPPPAPPNPPPTGPLDCVSNLVLRHSLTGTTIDTIDIISLPFIFELNDIRDSVGNIYSDVTALPTGGIQLNRATLVDGQSYTVSYRLFDAQSNQRSDVCTLQYVYDVGSAGTGELNNLSCAGTRWRDGTPVLNCGGAAVEAWAQLVRSDGQPLTSATAAVQFVQQNLPPGVVISIVQTDGTGGYLFRIDPSNANCSDTINGSIGV